ncbi:fascin-3-like [Polyodon spathula]|nr:fascin-3-like [Polyodon spathula]
MPDSNTNTLKVGIVSTLGKYLTSEYYANCVTAAGCEMRTNQIWDVEIQSFRGSQVVVALKGSRGLRLVVDLDGSVSCGASCTEPQNLFLLTFQPNGKWSFKSLATGTHLEADGEDVICVSENVRDEHLWTPCIAIHSHVVFFNIRSHLYLQADPEEDQVWAGATYPFNERCGFVMLFDKDKGKYHLRTSDGLYVSSVKKLVSKPSEKTALTFHLRPGYLASFFDDCGSRLFPHGRSGALLPGNIHINKDEWFVIKRNPCLITLKALNKNYATVTCGVEVYANRNKPDSHSLFELEVNPRTELVKIQTPKGRYLTLRGSNSVIADGDGDESNSLFEVEWRYGKVCFQASNGMYLTVKPIGLITASSPEVGPNEQFVVQLANRPFLMMRGKYGYVGKSIHHAVLQCNLPEPEQISLIPCKHGFYHFKGSNGNFWTMTENDTFKADGNVVLNFCIEIRGINLLAILAPNGCYLRGENSGVLSATGQTIDEDCLWEF